MQEYQETTLPQKKPSINQLSKAFHQTLCMHRNTVSTIQQLLATHKRIKQKFKIKYNERDLYINVRDCILRWEFSLGGFYFNSKLKINDFKILLFVSQKIRESTTLPLENTSRSKVGIEFGFGFGSDWK